MKKEIPEAVKPILEEVKVILDKIYGARLKGIVLYGSHARGDAVDGSDIDIMILLHDMEEPLVERENYFNAIWELDLKYDTVISIIPLQEEDFQKRRLPVILNAKREGVLIQTL